MNILEFDDKKKMSYKEKIKNDSLPQHVAVIMDGNGRWAAKQGLDRVVGHQNGLTAVRQTIEAAAELGLKYLTLYAFSTENWERPAREVDALMHLLSSAIEKETSSLTKNNIRLLVIGDLERMSEDIKEKITETIKATENNTGSVLILALSYSSRWEITEAVKSICKDLEANKISQAEINEALVSNHLSTSKIPDPDLLIRTSGELRISNFLLWQLAYSELYFTEVNWPDFKKEDFYKAIYEYQKRERRFGK